ncbi:sorting nexin-6 [Galendromus occidentalis]|uniref:Sorting nexin n=1 Tax=Galendromus occidentalis TaxID=34638 RepID=A0AAJ7L8H2_9ACAR|nr:sorting nexin-6 [Galendromus occidentalis]
MTEYRQRAETVDLNENVPALIIEISDALSERDKVKFTVRTKSTLSVFDKPELSVVRQHEEFVWLHTMLEENEHYAGYIIPPAPPRPNFDASREKLQRLGESESIMTVEEFNKLKAELESEYLATFKKTVAMHEKFLQRLANHQVFRDDRNLHVFLSYAQDLSVRGKNKKERLAGLFSSLGKSADGLLLQTTQKDIDDSFEVEKTFLTRYFEQLKEARTKADKVTNAQKNLARSYIRVSTALAEQVPLEMNNDLERFVPNFIEFLEAARKIEGRKGTDFDLKLSDTLRYYQRDSGAAKDLLYRRLRALANFEGTNRALEKARIKNKDVIHAEELQKFACEKFEDISTQAKQELKDFRSRRVRYFKKSCIDLAELQLKHCNAEISLLRETIGKMKIHIVEQHS